MCACVCVLLSNYVTVMVHSLTHSLTHSLSHPPTHSLTHSLSRGADVLVLFYLMENVSQIGWTSHQVRVWVRGER